LLIEPLVVFNENALTLSELLFDTNKNWPVLLTLGCSAMDTG
jgi:hypothetical protein